MNIISKDREVHAAQDLEQKIDLLSQYISALAALTLVVISVGEDGLLSKAGIVSDLFTKSIEKKTAKHSLRKWKRSSNLYLQFNRC